MVEARRGRISLYAIDDVPSCDSGDEEEKDDEDALDVKKLKYGVCVAISCYEVKCFVCWNQNM